MMLTLKRLNSGQDDTIGTLSINEYFACFTLEDEEREVKVAGETRIPPGTYQITLRDFGGKDAKYKTKFPGMHKGMLWLREVPGFEYVLIHIGNDDDDTDGCILVGNTCAQNVDRKGFISQSSLAYQRIYPAIAACLESGEEVWIEVENEV